MRAWGVLVLLVLGLGWGLASSPAGAAPCPLHAPDEAVPAAPAGAPARGEPVAAAEVVAEAVPALEPSSGAVPGAGFGHVVPDGLSCCHAAAAATLGIGPALGPRRVARVAAWRSWLPPWAAPTDGIFRPPALA